MSDPIYDVVAIGNAMVDILHNTSEEFIAKQDRLYGMKKGSMNLIDQKRAEDLHKEVRGGLITSGGSAGNTMSGFSSFGGKGAYIGKVADDKLGILFRHDMQSQNIKFDTASLEKGGHTGRCIIMVTPDAERTMNTFLGAAVDLGPEDIDKDLVASSRVTYLEGYLYDPEQAKKAFKLAAKIAHDAGHNVALTLSDPFCVDRHREDFVHLVEHYVDILFANDDEIMSLYQTDTFEEAANIVMGKCKVAALTRSEKGSVIVAADRLIQIPPEKVPVVDTTGAGDQYAAGFLYGFTRDMSMEQCGRLGSLAASEVIGHMGARPETIYADLVSKAAA